MLAYRVVAVVPRCVSCSERVVDPLDGEVAVALQGADDRAIRRCCKQDHRRGKTILGVALLDWGGGDASGQGGHAHQLNLHDYLRRVSVLLKA